VRVLLLGGTRFVGRIVARLLVDAGCHVTVLHRGIAGEAPVGTVSVIADRAQADGLAGVRDSRFDVVVDLSSYASEWTRAAVDAFAGRVGHYVYVSSGAVYRPAPELPWPESTPFGPSPIWGRYGEEKVASERMLWDAHGHGDLAVTVFRYPFILGPANFADRESFVLSRIETGRPILLPGGGRALNQFVHVDDVARALVVAIEHRSTSVGQAYNCAYERPITNRGWVELCADIAGAEARIVAIDEEELGVAAPVVDLADLVFPYPEEHYALDPAKLRRELGVEAVADNRRMLEDYLGWWREHGPLAPRSYPREEQALAALGLAAESVS
jgi:2'-hydroxyisoflavone reductase